MKRLVFTIFFLLGLFLLWVLPVGATDRYVTPTGTDLGTCTTPSAPCRTIQYAADRAANGDVVKVAQGVYYENLEVKFDYGPGAQGFTLQGGWNPDFRAREIDSSLTVIDGGGAGRVVDVLYNVADRSITIEYFTIQHAGGHQNGGGVGSDVTVDGAELTLKNNIIIANTASNGAGVYATTSEEGSLSVNLINNQIRSNFASMTGAVALYTIGGGQLTATLTGNLIVGNDRMGIVVLSWGENSRTAVTLLNNTLADSGTLGLYVYTNGTGATARVTARNCLITDGVKVEYNEKDKEPATVDLSYCATRDTLSGNVNRENSLQLTSSEPLFVDSSGGDYHLHPDSRAVDTGICGAWRPAAAVGPKKFTYFRLAPAADFEGDAMPPAPMELGCDIGADEAVATLAVPTESAAFAYASAQRPYTNAEAAQTQPLACGDLSEGTLNLELKLPRFTGQVDVYLGLYFPAIDPDNVYLITDENELQPVSAGLTPWRAATDGNIHTRLFGEVPLAGFPAGDYTLGVIVMPAGNLSASYLWATTFSP